MENLRESKAPMRLDDILALLKSITSGVPGGSDVDPWDIIGMYVTRLGNDIHQLLPAIKTAVDSGNLDLGELSQSDNINKQDLE